MRSSDLASDARIGHIERARDGDSGGCPASLVQQSDQDRKLFGRHGRPPQPGEPLGHDLTCEDALDPGALTCLRSLEKCRGFWLSRCPGPAGPRPTGLLSGLRLAGGAFEPPVGLRMMDRSPAGNLKFLPGKQCEGDHYFLGASATVVAVPDGP